VLVRTVNDAGIDARGFERVRVLPENNIRCKSSGVKKPAIKRGFAWPTSQNQISRPLDMNPNGA